MNKTILVVEDNPDNMALVEEIIEDAGFNIMQSVRAEDGIENLYKGGIDLVLMDISLPEMDGLEATKIIKADNTISSVPIIGLSAHAMDSDREAAISAGCDDYLTKPLDEELLLELINRLLK